ncbi:hypothetical protein [Flavivirga jejuensis]|uniref:Outer membrane protein with beta-barrel domain n=1 Tax=Flavivirga jejuensis TaxID=870487 RepID=A0ABT8WJB3_9FLAO|nr:hypothetical protein [Flavivirga jejuensis]MDO5973089.1 hypothetical protein [Flavivirga jejuensis]
MQIITKYLALAVLCVSVQLINAQDTIPAIKNEKNIKMLRHLKTVIEKEEKDFLKIEVEAINKRLNNGEITAEEAQELKMKAAKLAALNIENRIGIIDNKIALLERNDYGLHREAKDVKFGIAIDGDEVLSVRGKKKPKKYDLRTSSDFVLAFGLNNAIIEGEKLDDSPYKFGGSRFLELGWAWKTRVFKNTNFLRFKYGYSFQINGLKPDDNKYFVQQGNQTVLQEFPENLKKSKLSITNLVFPVHFEFGPSKRIDNDTYFRYVTRNQFKIGLGGYAGINIGTRQKLKYKLNGEHIKDKQKRGFNTSNLVYGLSGYIAISEMALYVKYDLSPIFKNQIVDHNNISIGVRFDVD